MNERNGIAVLARTNRELEHVRATAEQMSIPVRWFASRRDFPALHKIRECQILLQHLQQSRHSLRHASALREEAGRLFESVPPTPWTAYALGLLAAWQDESDNAELPVLSAIEFIYETCAEQRREFTFGEGLTLSTVHSAKGCEYDHVLLLGAWKAGRDARKLEEQRREFYVGMTRARKTLGIFDRADFQPSLAASLSGSSILRRSFNGQNRPPVPRVRYEVLSLEKIHLGFPARFHQTHPIHQALARSRHGDRMELSASGATEVVLRDSSGTTIAKLSSEGARTWLPRLPSVVEVRLLGLVTRRRTDDDDEERRQQCLVDQWEIPLVEVVTRSDG